MKQIVCIEKETMALMEPATLDVPAYVIDSYAGARAAVTAMLPWQVVGFDTETRPMFHRGERHHTALVQLATPRECFLFRTCNIGVPQVLQEFLEDGDHIKVGLSVNDDINGISHLCETFKPRGFVDIQDVVAKYDIVDLSLQKIYAILFNRRISKGQQLSNWEAPQLSPAQIRYGALDAYACLEIYNLLNSGTFDPARSPHRKLLDD